MKLNQYIVGCFVLILLSPILVFAKTDAYFESKKSTVSAGEMFEVSVFLDVHDEPVNTLETEIVFDPNILSLQEIIDGGSGVTFWVEPPGLIAPGRVRFSGVTPGGITQSKQFLLTLRFLTLSSGATQLQLESFLALKNDGLGTSVFVNSTPLTLLIEENVSGNSLGSVDRVYVDTVPPEEFSLTVFSDPSLFSGDWALIWTTNDKGSGIKEYQMREGYLGRWQKVESPYRLENQSLQKKIFLRAIDRQGNERLAVWTPSGILWFLFPSIFGILLLLLTFFVFRYVVKKSRR